MALVPSMSRSIPWCCCRCLEEKASTCSRVSFSPLFAISSRSSGFRFRKWRDLIVVQGRRRLNVETTSTSTSSVENHGAQIRTGIEIPVTCYQIVGVSDRAEKDEIVKAVMDLKAVEVEEGYTMDTVQSRQELLMDVRDKLLFEPEYAGNIREKVAPKSTLRLSWSWLPGALCLLQEVGEEKLVLEIGRAALQHPDAKPYVHDFLLSMALAECAIAKIEFEKNKVSQGFEALARAQYLLRSKISLGKMPLLSQIEESLEELAPACTLELLGMPYTPETAERRRGAIAALHELLRQGLDVESSCQVRDWPCFLSRALNKLMATEIVDLLPWENLALTRKNKKSLESQNQRVIIDFNCFYTAMLAHIALGFSSKQTNLIEKAKTISQCLAASEGIDLKFEEAFCSFLLGQGAETDAAERLREVESNLGPVALNNGASAVRKEVSGHSRVDPSLEIWLKDAVLGLFSDTRDCSSTFANFFTGEKRTFRAAKANSSIGVNKAFSSVSHRSPSFVLPSNHIGSDEPLPGLNNTRHLGVAVKQLAPANMQNPLPTINMSSTVSPSVQLKRELGRQKNDFWGSWKLPGGMAGRVTLVTVVGCFVFLTLKLAGIQFRQMKSLPGLHVKKPRTGTSALVWSIDPSQVKSDPGSIGRRVRKILMMFREKPKHLPDEGSIQSSLPVDDLLLLTEASRRRPMPIEEAEALVKQWQSIKAEALGPDHQVQCLSEVLTESMLAQWQDLADSAKAKPCFWRFVLLQLDIQRADVVSDGIGGEMAEIEALLKEAAELVDDSQSKNPNYYSMYKIRYILKRQYDGSWRFCRWGIQTST